MCALGCWWGGKITFFFSSWFKKILQKTTNLYTWRKSAHRPLYLALILQRSEQHHFFFFWVCCENLRNWPTHSPASVIVVLASSNLFHCTAFGSKSYTIISFCAKLNKLLKEAFHTLHLNLDVVIGFIANLFQLWCIALLKFLRHTKLRAERSASMLNGAWGTDTGHVCDFG